MGLISKDDVDEAGRASKRGSRGSMQMFKRYFKKILAFFSSTLLFGVIFSGGTTQTILDMALQGHIGWLNALQLSFVKALQYGTLKAPEFLGSMLMLFSASRPITALVNNAMPLAFLFISWFYLTSFFVDLLDGREGEVFRYWFQAVLTVVVIGFVFAMLNGLYMFSGAEPTFNNTEIANNLQSGNGYDPLADTTEPDASYNRSEAVQGNESVNESSGNSSYQSGGLPETSGFLSFLGGFIG